MTRESLGRLGCGLGSSLYVADDAAHTRRYFIGKDTSTPFLQAWLSDPPGMTKVCILDFSNNGWWTASTTVGWNAAMRDLHDLGWLPNYGWRAAQRRFGYDLPGGVRLEAADLDDARMWRRSNCVKFTLVADFDTGEWRTEHTYT